MRPPQPISMSSECAPRQSTLSGPVRFPRFSEAYDARTGLRFETTANAGVRRRSGAGAVSFQTSHGRIAALSRSPRAAVDP